MTFDQILGHDRQKEILSRSLASGRLAHAYLFSGPDGVGKRLMALALARAIVCHEQRGCGNCLACRKIDTRTIRTCTSSNRTATRSKSSRSGLFRRTST